MYDHDQLSSVMSLLKVTLTSVSPGSTSPAPDVGTVLTTTGGTDRSVIRGSFSSLTGTVGSTRTGGAFAGGAWAGAAGRACRSVRPPMPTATTPRETLVSFLTVILPRA